MNDNTTHGRSAREPHTYSWADFAMDDIAQMHIEACTPMIEYDEFMMFLRHSWLISPDFDGPTLLWNADIGEKSRQSDAERGDMPVVDDHSAERMITTPMQWYIDSVAAIVPTAQHVDDMIQMPINDMPTFRISSMALAGVDAVAGNAMMSTRWVESAHNLGRCVAMATKFVANVADRDGEGYDYLDDLVTRIRVYMSSAARNAEPSVGGQALREIVDVACNEDLRLNTMLMIGLLSCGLSFAHWDDSRTYAYDALGKALSTMSEFARHNGISSTNAGGDAAGGGSGDTGGIDDSCRNDAVDDFDYLDDLDDLDDTKEDPETAQAAHRQFRNAVLFLRHDLMRASGDVDEADQFLLDHRDVPAMASAYICRLAIQDRWEELLPFADAMKRDHPDQKLPLYPRELVPYGWDSVREIAMEALGMGLDLRDMYRERIVEAYDPTDTLAALHLKMLSHRSWPDQLEQIVNAYDDGNGRYARNTIYERLMLIEGMRDEARRYCRNFPEAREDLAPLLD